ncbi:unnamed protein product, partial [Anisakis simplex]|uniref:Splicing factor 45 n=1 Tax=Anisakis simplex TaxID=6269 RepID=A0A0M3K3V1_ANISI
MSLYDIFGEDPVQESSKKGGDSRSAGKRLPSGLRFLQSQIQVKKFQLNQAQRTVVAPVVDLSARNKSSTTSTAQPIIAALRPHKAIPLGEGPPLSFIPKALKEDKHKSIPWMERIFSMILVEAFLVTSPIGLFHFPWWLLFIWNDQIFREHQEELSKRSSGAAIAPPQALMESDNRLEPEVSMSSTSGESGDMHPPVFMPPFGVGKGMGVAANIMTKFGYKEGAGLGRTGQGMSTALKVERLGKNAGVIVNEHEQNLRAAAAAATISGVPSPPEFVAPELPPPVGVPHPVNAPPVTHQPAANMTEALKNATRILMLQNMVGADEIDDRLEPEVKDEMKKYGQVTKLLNVSDEEAVRIFIEFTNVAQAIKAFVDLNGRYF